MGKSDTEKMVTLPYAIAESLISDKIRSLNLEIERILKKWNQTDIEIFEEATRHGTIPEAETDAIIVGNLNQTLKQLEKLKANL